MPTAVQKKTAATCKVKETSRTTEPNAPLRPLKKDGQAGDIQRNRGRA